MLLKNSNLEIFLSSLGASSGSPVNVHTLLLPTIAIPSTATGRHTVVRYPVHKTIVCGDSVDGLLAYTRLMGGAHVESTDAIRVTFNFGLRETSKQRSSATSCVDLERAETALDRFRQSVQNATEYGHGWTGSGVQQLLEWMSVAPMDDSINHAVKNLIVSVLDEAIEGIASEEKRRLRDLEGSTVPEEVRQSLVKTVSAWAERAHTELRDSLDEGFTGKLWRKLVWWKLFWRVDDVGMITSSVLEKKLLPRAEKEVIWMGGKFQQAGLINQAIDLGRKSSHALPAQGSSDETALLSSTQLWPMQIAWSRTRLLNSTIPALQALAQGLVLSSVSTTTLTSALSALMYVSTSSTTLYEACTVAAIGLIYSLRRQQKKWESARSFWEREVREEGRRALKETEESFRALARDGGRSTEDITETAAREQIDKAKRALSNVK
jgi:hypothetical protein